MNETVLTQSEFNQVGVKAIRECFEFLNNSKVQAAKEFADLLYNTWHETKDFESEVKVLTEQWKDATFNLKKVKSLSEFFDAVKATLQGEEKTIWKNGFYNMILRRFFENTGLAIEYPCQVDSRGFAAKAVDTSKTNETKPANIKTSDKAGLNLETQGKGAFVETKASRDYSLAVSAMTVLNAPRKVNGQLTNNMALIELAINSFNALDKGAKNELVNALRAMSEALPHLIKAA